MPKFHIIHFILLYICSFQQIVAQNSIQINDEQNAEIEKLLSEAQLNFQTDVEKSLSLAQKIESKLTKSDNLTDKAKVFTLLGNIYGLKKDRTDKAADYHNKAFQIYNQLFKAKQIIGKHFYTFFSENVAPIYELISSENYNKRRRDKIAIRKYQELYTELSRFFLNEGFKEVESPNVDKIVQKKKTFVANNTQLEEKVTRQIEFNFLGGKLLQLYDSYINALEKKFGEKDASINDLKKDFMEKKKQIEKEMKLLNLAIVEKDSIILQEQNAFIKIEDNGLGIAEEHLAKVFEMFYRANDSIKGSGLGLYIVKQSIDKLGGTIALSSQLGEGTCFEVQVPNFPVN